MKVLDIFSDASVLGKVDKTRGNRVCAGAISVINDRRDKEYHCIIENNTNNYGELTGLYLAIQLAAEYKDEYTEFNAFIDNIFKHVCCVTNVYKPRFRICFCCFFHAS